MTLIKSEATQELATPAPPEARLLYCIKHGMVKAEQGDCGTGHIEIVHTDTGDEIEFCCFEGGFAFCPPPDIPEGWECQEPSLEEREQRELEGIELWLGVE